MTATSITTRGTTEARWWLADLVLTKASESAERVGFGWRASPQAPDTYEGLIAEFTECQAAGRDMRVGGVNAIPSIYGSARATFAMRFWHDVTHVEMEADFGFNGEMRVAEALLADVVTAGMDQGTLAWHLMRADTVGQNYVFVMTGGGFVPNQLDFATTAVKVNLPYAVLAAVEQIEGRSITGRDTDTLLKLMDAGS